MIKKSLALVLAQRFRKGRRRSGMVSVVSFISTLSIALGVTVLLIGLSAMNGFERELHNRILSVIPHGEVFDYRGAMTNWREIQTELQAMPHIVATEPYVSMTGLVEHKAALKAVQIKGIDFSAINPDSHLTQFIRGIDIKHILPDQQQIILGSGVAAHLGVIIGDNVTIMVASQNEEKSTSLQQPKRIRLTVAGLLELSGDLGNQFALVPLQDAQKYSALGENVTGMSVTVDDLFQARSIIFSAASRVSEVVNARSWEADYGYMYRDIQMIRSIMYISMVLVIGVACFNIISTLIIAVKDKSADIAILCTLGANERLIRSVFMWYGLLSGVIGGIVGLIFGVLCALNLSSIVHFLEKITGHHFLSGDIYFIDFIPSELHLMDVIAVFSTVLVLSLLASWYPARRASKIHPARVLSGL